MNEVQLERTPMINKMQLELKSYDTWILKMTRMFIFIHLMSRENQKPASAYARGPTKTRPQGPAERTTTTNDREKYEEEQPRER